MSFNTFKARIAAIAERANETILGFSQDEHGRYIARFSDNTRIIANATSSKVTVLFGSGHQAMATL